MPLNTAASLLVILAVALTTFATRALPFLIFPKGRPVPKTVEYLGRVLTPAVIGMLVIYCLKDTPIVSAPHGIPEAAAVLAVVLLNLWKRNNLLSIGGGTILYMFLVQAVF